MIDIDRLHKGYRTADGGHSEVLRGLSLRVPALLPPSSAPAAPAWLKTTDDPLVKGVLMPVSAQ